MSTERNILLSQAWCSLSGMTKIVLFLGPSGAGKSTLIRSLVQLDPQFRYVAPYTTRPLREGEVDKIHVSREQMNYLESRGQLLARNTLYGYEYGTPRGVIRQYLDAGIFPCLDWPINRLCILTMEFSEQLFNVYVSPPSIKVLQQRLVTDGRDRNGVRAAQAKAELRLLKQGRYDDLIDLGVCSHEGMATVVAHTIRSAVKSLELSSPKKPPQ